MRLLVFLAFAIVLSASFVRAQQMHDPNDPNHWYDLSCCSLNDCRPISGIDKNGVPWSEVEDMGDHFIWRSSLTGNVHTVPKGSKIRPSRDGFYHGCESAKIAFCIYEPVMF